MTRRMTVVFDDEELYTNLKVEAARSHRAAKDIVACALQLYFEATRDEYEAIIARARTRNGRAIPDGDHETRLLAEIGMRR